MAKACILGISGTAFSADERKLFSDVRPWGLILFARNIEHPEQVRALIDEFRRIVGHKNAPVLIDQEGGRVQRLKPPLWQAYPATAVFAEIYRNDQRTGIEAVSLCARLIAYDLASLGINVNCLPVADVLHPEGHGIIGDRSYGSDPKQVAVLARAAAEGLMRGGVLPVLKHIPGHGRAKADSHEVLPVVETPRTELEQVDFEAFRLLHHMPIGMTAHVVYAAIDRERPATISPKVIGDVVRNYIGFDGLLMTDDLSMKALSGSFRERAEAAIAAGCDINLHCNGRMEEMLEVVAGTPELMGDALDRAGAALGRLNRTLESFDAAEAWTRFSAMIAIA